MNLLGDNYRFFMPSNVLAISSCPNSSIPARLPFSVRRFWLTSCLLVSSPSSISVMARPAFKGWWILFVPQPVEWSIYVLLARLALALLFLAVAISARCCLACWAYCRALHFMDPLLFMLGNGAGWHMPDQSFRSVWLAAGVALSAWRGIYL